MYVNNKACTAPNAPIPITTIGNPVRGAITKVMSNTAEKRIGPQIPASLIYH